MKYNWKPTRACDQNKNEQNNFTIDENLTHSARRPTTAPHSSFIAHSVTALTPIYHCLADVFSVSHDHSYRMLTPAHDESSVPFLAATQQEYFK